MKKNFSKNKIIFFGTPHFSAEILSHLIDHEVSIEAVVTQPDRAQGRSASLTPSPVKQLISSRLSNVAILQPEKVSQEDFLEELKRLKADLYVVVAFGQILPQKLLDIPPLGCINVHASLLPNYRGAAPIQRCLMNGDILTGVSIQKMVKKMDAGDVIASSEVPISQEMNFGQLQQALCEESKSLLLEVLALYEKGVPEADEQNHHEATFAPKISTQDGQIDWNKSSFELHNLIRALSPKPGAWCYLPGSQKIVKILQAKEVGQEGVAGKLLSRSEGIIACGKGALQLLQVQSEGKKIMTWSDWIRGSLHFSGFI